MKIKLLVDLPLDRKHGATAGRIFKVTRTKGPESRFGVRFFFVGDAGEECAAYFAECEEVLGPYDAAKRLLEGGR